MNDAPDLAKTQKLHQPDELQFPFEVVTIQRVYTLIAGSKKNFYKWMSAFGAITQIPHKPDLGFYASIYIYIYIYTVEALVEIGQNSPTKAPELYREAGEAGISYPPSGYENHPPIPQPQPRGSEYSPQLQPPEHSVKLQARQHSPGLERVEMRTPTENVGPETAPPAPAPPTPIRPPEALPLASVSTKEREEIATDSGEDLDILNNEREELPIESLSSSPGTKYKANSMAMGGGVSYIPEGPVPTITQAQNVPPITGKKKKGETQTLVRKEIDMRENIGEQGPIRGGQSAGVKDLPSMRPPVKTQITRNVGSRVPVTGVGAGFIVNPSQPKYDNEQMIGGIIEGGTPNTKSTHISNPPDEILKFASTLAGTGSEGISHGGGVHQTYKHTQKGVNVWDEGYSSGDEPTYSNKYTKKENKYSPNAPDKVYNIYIYIYMT